MYCLTPSSIEERTAVTDEVSKVAAAGEKAAVEWRGEGRNGGGERSRFPAPPRPVEYWEVIYVRVHWWRKRARYGMEAEGKRGTR